MENNSLHEYHRLLLLSDMEGTERELIIGLKVENLKIGKD
jgi:hypothetical protein